MLARRCMRPGRRATAIDRCAVEFDSCALLDAWSATCRHPSGLDERPERVRISLPERCRFEAELVACAVFVEPSVSANEVEAHVPVADAENVGSHLTDGSAALLDRLLEATTGGAGFAWPDQVIDYVRTAAWSRRVWVAVRMPSRRGGSVETTSTGEGPR